MHHKQKIMSEQSTPGDQVVNMYDEYDRSIDQSADEIVQQDVGNKEWDENPTKDEEYQTHFSNSHGEHIIKSMKHNSQSQIDDLQNELRAAKEEIHELKQDFDNEHAAGDEDGNEGHKEEEIEELKLFKNSIFSTVLGIEDEQLDTSENFPIDLNSLACMLATDPSNDHRSVFRCVLPLIFATAFSWFKIIILGNILVDAMFVRCTSSDQCNDGTFCLPVNIMFPWKAINSKNSFCNDCIYFDLALNLTEHGDHPQREFILDGYDQCEGDDPDTCEFIMNNRARMSPLTIVLLFLIWTTFSMLILHDLNKVSGQKKFMEKRVQNLKNKFHIGALQVTNWFFFASIGYIIPSWMTIGVALLILGYPPEARSLIIVPLEIGLIANFDEVTNFLFIGKNHQKTIHCAAKILDSSPSTRNVPSSNVSNKILEGRYKSVYTRLFSYCLGFVAVLFAVYPASGDRLSDLLLALVGNSETFEISDPCARVFSGAINYPLVVTAPVAALNALFDAARRPAQNWKYRLTYFLNVPAMFCIVMYSWIPVFYLLLFLQFQAL